jgi:hypothetical protein
MPQRQVTPGAEGAPHLKKKDFEYQFSETKYCEIPSKTGSFV